MLSFFRPPSVWAAAMVVSTTREAIAAALTEPEQQRFPPTLSALLLEANQSARSQPPIWRPTSVGSLTAESRDYAARSR